MKKNSLSLMCHFDSLERHIDEVGKILYGIDNNIFTVSESFDCP